MADVFEKIEELQEKIANRTAPGKIDFSTQEGRRAMNTALQRSKNLSALRRKLEGRSVPKELLRK